MQLLLQLLCYSEGQCKRKHSNMLLYQSLIVRFRSAMVSQLYRYIDMCPCTTTANSVCEQNHVL
jgi:hypothetical protein